MPLGMVNQVGTLFHHAGPPAVFKLNLTPLLTMLCGTIDRFACGHTEENMLGGQVEGILFIIFGPCVFES